MKMIKEQAASRIVEIGIVPVVRASSAEYAIQAAEAVCRGGIPIVEITMTVPGAIEAISHLVKSAGAGVLIGAGTVLDAETAQRCVDAGAEFIVSPGFDFVKIFPCGAVGGAKYIRALKAPLPQVPLIPTGGVNLNTAADFIHAGAAALGIGSELVSTDAIKSGNLNEIVEASRKYVAIVREARRLSAVH